jgi:hypothetical protein
MTPAEFAARLGAKREGSGWRAKCPAHEDTHPSLMIGEGRKGDVLLTCHAGCTPEAIVHALGLTLRDLFADAENGATAPLGRVVAHYDYEDAAGTVVYRIVRYAPKTFRPQHLDGLGGWVTGMNGGKALLYHLPEVLAAVPAGKRIWIPEGEKDVEALRALGKVATCNPFGAGKWRPEYTESLRGADVVLIPDKDEAGHAHMKQVAAALDGVARRVVIREAAIGKDVSDHLAAGKTLAELVAPAPLPPPAATAEDGFIRVGVLIAEPDNPHPWVVHGLVPAGGMALVAGKPKAGKSTLARAIALRVCRGEPVLGRDTLQGPVLYLGLEDPREAIKGHFRRMGAAPTDDVHVYLERVPEHAQAWLAAQLTKRDPVLVVIDTMQFFLGIAEINEYGQVVNALRSILELFRGRRAAVLIVHHAGKGERTGMDAVLGSTGITGTVDTTILVKRRADDQGRTITTQQRMHAPGGEDMPETVLTLDDHTEPRLAGTRADYDVQKMGEAILGHLLAQPAADWYERKAVLEAVEGAGQLKVKALDTLFRSGQVDRQGRGLKGDPFLFRAARTELPNAEMPFCRSPHTVRTAERNPGTVASVGGSKANSVLPFSGLGVPGPDARTESGRLCPKGHSMTHLPGSDASTGWVCGTCYPAALPAGSTAGSLAGSSAADAATTAYGARETLGAV